MQKYNDNSIRIRRFRVEDVPELFSATQETADQLRRWMTWYAPDYTLQHCVDFVSSRDAKWKTGEEYSFVIASFGDDAFLGSIGLSRVDPVHRLANLGYWVRNTRTRQGIASAAVRLAARFAFEQLGLNRLELIVPLGNRSSMRVAEKSGAHLEGVLKQRLMLKGHPRDAVSYALVAPAKSA